MLAMLQLALLALPLPAYAARLARASPPASLEPYAVNDPFESMLNGTNQSGIEKFYVGGFQPTTGSVGRASAGAVGGVCPQDSYQPSIEEGQWKAHANAWTSNVHELCSHLGFRGSWIAQISRAGPIQTGHIFSKLCKAGEKPQALEPLAGLLRSPRHMCDAPSAHLMDVDYLVLADAASLGLQPGARRIFFDAGGSNFADALKWFTSAYSARGINFDKIFVWEAQWRTPSTYWGGTPPAIRARWEPRVVFYNGVPVTTGKEDKANNVVERIKAECRPMDFCAWKLDIDHPPTESALVKQLLADPDAQSRLDEFFFEHHVTGLMQKWWRSMVAGTFADSYSIFDRLRHMGIRAHSWV